MDASQDPLLCVNNVNKTFLDGPTPVVALDHVSFSVTSGEIVCLLGPSGCGKSTMLRIIGGLIPASEGEVFFHGKPLVEPHPEIGFVFQKTNLMPWRTVLQNILLPLELQQSTASDESRQRALELLELVGLDGFADAYPKQLSGGMSQRVVLARTLIHQPQLLLMDEPFGALDSLTRERLNLELLRIQQIQTSTILLVTHSIAEAVFLADRVIVFSDRPGRVKAQICIDLPRPRRISVMGSEQFGQLTMQVRQFIGEQDSFIEHEQPSGSLAPANSHPAK